MDFTSLSHGSRFVSTAVDHPRLTRTDAASVRLVLRAYGQYVREVSEQSHQVTGQDFATAEASCPMQVSYCVEAKWLECLIGLRLLQDVTS